MSMTEPIPFTVTRYRCPTCPRTASSKARTREHMARCWSNPDNRGCKTCKHFEPYEAGDCDSGVLYSNDEPEHCAVGIDLHREVVDELIPEGAIVSRSDQTSPLIHCASWEAKP